MEPELKLTEEERRAKEKRMNEIKKMIALQSLQQFSEDPHVTTNHSNSNYGNYMGSTYQHHEQVDFQKEKKARERVKKLSFFKFNKILILKVFFFVLASRFKARASRAD
jgi:hypothetical protein